MKEQSSRFGDGMPELPDVEYARQRLRTWLRGGVVTRAQSSDRRIMRPAQPAALSRALVGHRIEKVERRGKWLKIELDNGGRLFSHLGMTGLFIEDDVTAPKHTAERARIDVRKKSGKQTSVRYLDARRFGRLIIANEDIPEWGELGPDPLIDGIEPGRLNEIFAKSRRAVKDVLMDQSVLAGIGNILATEALWHARIDPRARANGRSAAEVKRIARALDTEIQKELVQRVGGVSYEESTAAFLIYGRARQPCPRCKEALAHVVVGGRGTTFCKRCQVGGKRRSA